MVFLFNFILTVTRGKQFLHISKCCFDYQATSDFSNLQWTIGLESRPSEFVLTTYVYYLYQLRDIGLTIFKGFNRNVQDPAARRLVNFNKQLNGH